MKQKKKKTVIKILINQTLHKKKKIVLLTRFNEQDGKNKRKWY